jgi:SAM-dependent methyltransferase
MICLSCGSTKLENFSKATDVEYFTTDDIFNYNRCLSCDTLSIDPIPSDQLSLIYPKNYYSFQTQKAGFLLKVKIYLDGLLFKKILSQLKENTINALDIGGGAGWMLDVLMSCDPRISKRQVVDIDAQAKSLAEQKGHSYFCGKFEDFKYVEKFNLILMLNLIEHVENPKEILKKAYDCLEKDGFVLIKTPNFKSLDANLFRHNNWGGYHCPRHWVLFSMDSFESLAKSIGFSIDKKSYTQGSPFWAWSTLHLLQRGGLVTVSADKPAFQHSLIPFLMLFFAVFDFLRMPFFKTSQMIFVLKKT